MNEYETFWEDRLACAPIAAPIDHTPRMHTTRRHRWRGVGVGLAAGALLLSACGGGSDDAGEATIVEAPIESSAGDASGSTAANDAAGDDSSAAGDPATGDDTAGDAADDPAPDDTAVTGDAADDVEP